MCDFSGKLVAWMDGELRESDTVDVERHLSACGECRELLASYEQASGAFKAFCEATFTAGTRQPGLPRQALVAYVAAGVAAAVAIAVLLLSPLERVAQTPARLESAAGTMHAAEEGANGRSVEALAAIRARAETALPAVRAGNIANMAGRTYASQVSPKQSPGSQRQITPTPEPAPRQSADAFPVEPPIQIDIPADAMFPPGAFPPGMTFSADLTISADGSPERLGLRPRLAGFERRTNQP
jgi:anti-sigma factor RsiW